MTTSVRIDPHHGPHLECVATLIHSSGEEVKQTIVGPTTLFISDSTMIRIEERFVKEEPT